MTKGTINEMEDVNKRDDIELTLSRRRLDSHTQHLAIFDDHGTTLESRSAKDGLGIED